MYLLAFFATPSCSRISLRSPNTDATATIAGDALGAWNARADASSVFQPDIAKGNIYGS